MSGDSDGISGLTVTDASGQQYFIFGKNRIKIVERFSDSGPTLENALSILIQQKIKEMFSVIEKTA